MCFHLRVGVPLPKHSGRLFTDAFMSFELEMLPEQGHVLWKGMCFDTERGAELNWNKTQQVLKLHLKKEFYEEIMNEAIKSVSYSDVYRQF